jgi:hypothetical protein
VATLWGVIAARKAEQADAEPLWTITDAGAAYLAALRDRAQLAGRRRATLLQCEDALTR